ncbi:hypothetical protein JYT72_01585, partial [Crocinitomix catalasitica]|nr:hypothetical protein [Crocinitomix catalasitica]
MKKLACIFVISVLFVSCGSEAVEDTDENVETESKFYSTEGVEMSAAVILREKLGKLNATFTEISTMDLEESVCP